MFEKPEDSVRSKMNRLGFVGLVEEEKKIENQVVFSSTLELPEELPTVETVVKKLVAAKKPVSVIAEVVGNTEDSVRSKMNRLGFVGLNLVVDDNNSGSAESLLLSSPLVLPEELPSVETVLKTAAAAMKELETPGLSKTEVMRLRAIIQSAAVYQVKVAEYLDYRGIEARN